MQQSILPYFFFIFFALLQHKIFRNQGYLWHSSLLLEELWHNQMPLCSWIHQDSSNLPLFSTLHNTPQSGKNCVVKGGRRRKQHKLTLSRSAPTIEAEDTPRLKKSKYIMIRKEQIQSAQTLTSCVKMHVKDSSICCIYFAFSLLFPQCCKRPSQSRQGNVCESSFSHCSITTTPPRSSRGTVKHHRYDI